MGYKHDIFISYRRDEEARRWLNNHFLPLLEFRLKMELGYSPSIYTDQQLEVGALWPSALGDAIASSRILLVLWSRNYLNSEWCVCEMSHMLERESTVGFRQNSNSNSLIVPVIVHDGENLPPPLAIGQKLEIRDSFNPRMSVDSPKAEKLADDIGKAAEGIAKLVTAAPAWQPDWNTVAKNKFFSLYYDNALPMQSGNPKFTTA